LPAASIDYDTDGISFSMVAKGAFLASVDSNLGRREFARMSYGALYGLQYDPKIHNPADAVRTPGYFWFEWEVRDTMQWAIKKWQDLINPESPMVIEGHHYIEEVVCDAIAGCPVDADDTARILSGRSNWSRSSTSPRTRMCACERDSNSSTCIGPSLILSNFETSQGRGTCTSPFNKL
jgi:hypothetical protein